jgi:hypothetical protein
VNAGYADDEDDSGGNADDETSDAGFALCALSDGNGLDLDVVRAMINTDADDDGGTDESGSVAEESYVCFSGFAAEVSADEQRCLSHDGQHVVSHLEQHSTSLEEPPYIPLSRTTAYPLNNSPCSQRRPARRHGLCSNLTTWI